jgi:hypothetical protein
VLEKTKAYKVLVGMPERKRPLERLRCRLEDDIKIDLREVGLGCLSGSGQGPVVNTE